MHSIKAIWCVETRCTPPPAASNASGSPKAARDAGRGGWMGGGFGAGVVKASEAHVMQCENSQCEWKHSAEAKPHWETQSVVDVTLEGDSENLPVPTSNTRTCTDQHERDQLAPNLHAHNQRVTKKMSTRCIGGHRFALHMSRNGMENPKSCTVPSHGSLNCR